MTTPPETRREEVTEERHGEETTDPYRWLEGDGDDVDEWVAAQNDHARETLAGYPHRESLADRFEDLVTLTEYGGIEPTDAGYYQQVRDPEDEQPVLYFRESLDDERSVVVDANELSEDGTTSVDWWAPSTDGSLVAYGVADGGDENYDVVVHDALAGETVDRVPDTGRGGNVSWTEDGFYFQRTGSAEEGAQLDTELCFYDRETGSVETVYDDFDPQDMPGVSASDDGEHVVVSVSEGWNRTDLYRLVDGELEDLVVGRDARYGVVELEDHTLYLRTSEDAPRWRAATLDLDADDPALRELLPEREAVLEGYAVVEDRLVAAYLEDAAARLAVYDHDGEHLTDLSVPDLGSVGALAGHEDELFAKVDAPDVPPTVVRYDLTDGTRTDLARPDVDVPDIEVRREFYEAPDGSEAPMFVVGAPDRDRPAPTVVSAYGGFGISITPGFSALRLPFFEAGGTVVQVVARGGGEYGEEWHEAAQFDRKQRTFDDVTAAAERLVEAGETAPDRLGIAGGSNGGLTVGACVTQRPDLWAAAYCTVPLLDMLRFHTALLGEYWTREYGNPDDAEAFEYIREYSPYHNAPPADYPAVLFKTAASDTRVHPFHARKMTALLQENQRADDPILLRTETETGHGVGKPVSQRVAEAADQWAFFYEHLGVRP